MILIGCWKWSRCLFLDGCLITIARARLSSSTLMQIPLQDLSIKVVDMVDHNGNQKVQFFFNLLITSAFDEISTYPPPDSQAEKDRSFWD